MAGGDGQLTQAQKQQEKIRIRQSLINAADQEQSPDFSLEESIETKKQFIHDMNLASQRLEVLGISDVQYYDESLSSAGLRKYSGYAEASLRDAEKEASYSQKSGKEEAAIKRGEFSGVRTDRMNSGIGALLMYRQLKAQGNQAPQPSECSGKEFMEVPGQTDTVFRSKICNMMRYRDSTKAWIEQTKKGVLDERDKIYLKHKEELLSCMSDAIKTWFYANGIDEEGCRVFDFTRNKAKKHLPLALEKYEYRMRNFDRLFAEELLRSDAIKQDPAWKGKEKELRDAGKASAASQERIDGIADQFGGESAALLNMIAGFRVDHPEAYEANKEKLDSVFRFYTQRLKRSYDIGLHLEVADGVYDTMFGGSKYEKQISSGLWGIKRANDATQMALRLEAEAARDYIEYLISGKRTDPLHAACIERLWGEKRAYEQDPHAPLRHAESEMKKYGETAYRTRYKRESHRYGTSPEALEIERRMHEAWIDDKVQNPVERREALSRSSERSQHIRERQERLKNSTDLAALRQQGHFRNPAFRDISTCLTSFGGDQDIDDRFMVITAKSLVIAKTGIALEDDTQRVTDQMAEDTLRGLMDTYLPAVRDMVAYMGNNPKMLQKRGLGELFKYSEQLPMFRERATGLRDSLQILFESPAYELLHQREKDDIKEAYISVTAMHEAASALERYQRAFCDMTADQVLAIPGLDSQLDKAVYDVQLSLVRAEVEKEDAGQRRYRSL